MKGAFSLLTERTGKIHSAEGEHDVLWEMFPDWSGEISLFSLVPKQQHDFIGDVLRNVSRNAEGRISDVSLLTAAGQLVLFHLTVQPAGPGLWWFKFNPTDSQADQQPTMVWVDFFDSVSYLVESSPEQPIELMLLSFEALSRGQVVVVSPVLATNPLFTLLLAMVLLRGLEQITLRVIAGTCLVVLGIVVLTVA